MALRMNLFGCRLQAITEAIGSKDSEIFESATAKVSELLREESREKGVAWVQTLVHDGYPLRSSREPPDVQDDGGLLVSHLETEIHVFALHSIVLAVAQADCLELSGKSSAWTIGSISALYRDLRACGFTNSKECPEHFVRWISALSDGTPLFGDAFQTSWSFYTFLTNQELQDFVATLVIARNFERKLPPNMPDHVRKSTTVGLPDNGKAHVDEFADWLGAIQKAGQDAYILWW